MSPRIVSPRVLIAITDRYLLAQYVPILQEDGFFDVVAVTDGVQCMAQLRTQPPDLLILDSDLLWGGADGVLSVMAEEPDIAETPAMVISSGRNRSALYQISRFVIGNYQIKPVPRERLIQHALAMLERRGNGTHVWRQAMPGATSPSSREA